MYDINFLNDKRILVTGGAGFIGGTLIRKLILESNFKIYNIDKIGYASDINSINYLLNKLGKKAIGRYELFNIDLINFEAVKKCC